MKSTPISHVTPSSYVQLKESMRLVFGPDHPVQPWLLVVLTWAASAMMSGKPARCVGFLPGLTLQMQSRLNIDTLTPELFETTIPLAMERLAAWVDNPTLTLTLHLSLPETDALVIADDGTLLMPATVLYERQYRWDYSRYVMSAE